MSRTPPASGPGAFRRKLGKLLRLAPDELAELASATVALLAARITLARSSTATLVSKLKRGAPPDAGDADPALATRLARLEWAIDTAARNLPWRTDCIVRVIAADRMLRRRGLVPEFYLGATRRADGSFAAHAWLRCRGIPVAGGDGAEFTVLIGPENPPPA